MDHLLMIIDHLFNDEFDSLKDSFQRINYAFDKIDSIQDLRRNMHQFLSDHQSRNRKSVFRSQEYRLNGNRYFQKRNFEYALYFYNLAVMCAPYPPDVSQESDDELSLAFTSRSMTFYEMQCYSNALFDIDCALRMSSSMRFYNRLELMLHKVYCLEHLGKNRESQQLVSQMIQLIPCLPINNELVDDLILISDSLSHPRDKQVVDRYEAEDDHKLIEDICKNVDKYVDQSCKLFVTESKGRHFRAKNPIPNKTIVMIDKSYSAILFKSFFTTHCQNCFENIGYKSMPCRRCNQVVFCDGQCAEEAFYHSYECGIADIIDGLGATHYIVLRLLLLIGPNIAIKLAKQTLSDSSDMNIKNYIQFLSLVDHREGYDLQTKVLVTYRSIQLALILNFFEEFKFDEKNLLQSMKELAVILESNNYKVLTNAFGMYEQKTKCRTFRGQHIGNAVCLIPSLFNHSCDPNLFWQFNGNHITLITTRDIKSGEELSISYGPYSENMSFNERHNLLKSRYHFVCNCSACLHDAKQLQTLKCNNCGEGLIIYTSDSIHGSCLVCQKEHQISAIIKRVEQIDELFNYWMNEFEKQTDSELILINAERCYSDFCKLLYDKSLKMSEINKKLSRSFELFGDYRKAMLYSKKALASFDDSESACYGIEMVFFTRVYYLYLYGQRASFKRDKEWNQCFEVISETILILRKCKKQLLSVFANKTWEPDELKLAEKRINVINDLLSVKEKQLYFISRLNYY